MSLLREIESDCTSPGQGRGSGRPQLNLGRGYPTRKANDKENQQAWERERIYFQS
jgi:hypothetical protein